MFVLLFLILFQYAVDGISNHVENYVSLGIFKYQTMSSLGIVTCEREGINFATNWEIITPENMIHVNRIYHQGSNDPNFTLDIISHVEEGLIVGFYHNSSQHRGPIFHISVTDDISHQYNYVEWIPIRQCGTKQLRISFIDEIRLPFNCIIDTSGTILEWKPPSPTVESVYVEDDSIIVEIGIPVWYEDLSVYYSVQLRKNHEQPNFTLLNDTKLTITNCEAEGIIFYTINECYQISEHTIINLSKLRKDLKNPLPIMDKPIVKGNSVSIPISIEHEKNRNRIFYAEFGMFHRQLSQFSHILNDEILIDNCKVQFVNIHAINDCDLISMLTIDVGKEMQEICLEQPELILQELDAEGLVLMITSPPTDAQTTFKFIVTYTDFNEISLDSKLPFAVFTDCKINDINVYYEINARKSRPWPIIANETILEFCDTEPEVQVEVIPDSGIKIQAFPPNDIPDISFIFQLYTESELLYSSIQDENSMIVQDCAIKYISVGYLTINKLSKVTSINTEDIINDNKIPVPSVHSPIIENKLIKIKVGKAQWFQPTDIYYSKMLYFDLNPQTAKIVDGDQIGVDDCDTVALLIFSVSQCDIESDVFMQDLRPFINKICDPSPTIRSNASVKGLGITVLPPFPDSIEEPVYRYKIHDRSGKSNSPIESTENEIILYDCSIDYLLVSYVKTNGLLSKSKRHLTGFLKTPPKPKIIRKSISLDGYVIALAYPGWFQQLTHHYIEVYSDQSRKLRTVRNDKILLRKCELEKVLIYSANECSHSAKVEFVMGNVMKDLCKRIEVYERYFKTNVPRNFFPDQTVE